ncbi:MAG: TAXI family TRAP transporter solute-binding subunit [Thalassobaculales bacterium]
MSHFARLLRRAGISFAALLLVLAEPAAGQSYNLAMAGASPGGLWTLLGTGIHNAIAAAYPGSNIIYQASRGSFANVSLLTQKRVPLALISNATLRLATSGAEPFRTPQHGLMALAQLYNFTGVQLVIARDFVERHNVASLADIADRRLPLRVGIARRGNIIALTMEMLLREAGIEAAGLKEWGGDLIHASVAEQAEMLQEGRLDMVTTIAFVGHPSVKELGHLKEVVMLPVPAEIRQRMRRKLGLKDFVLKGGAYDFMPRDLPTLGLAATLTAHETLDSRIAYDLTRALIAQIEELRKVHPAMQELTRELLPSETAIPYHPGAIRAYREAGLMPTPVPRGGR